MQYFDDGAKTWKPFPSMAQLTEATDCSCAEYVGDYLYVAAKKANDFVNYRYDTVSNSWETLPAILSHSDFCNRQIDPLCFLDDFLYAISGASTCVSFKYSPAKNNWQGGASLGFLKKEFDDPNSRLTNATATVWKSYIYIYMFFTVLRQLKRDHCLDLRSRLPHRSTRSSLRTAASPPSAVSSGGLFGATTPSAVITTGSVLGVRSATSATSTGCGTTISQSTGASLFGARFGTAPTPFAGRNKGSDFRVGSVQSAFPTEGSLPKAGSTSLAFESSNNSQVWADKAAVLHCFNPKTNKWKQQSSTCHPYYDSCLFVINNRLYVAGGAGPSLYPSASVEVYDEGNNIWSVVEQKHIPPKQPWCRGNRKEGVFYGQ